MFAFLSINTQGRTAGAEGEAFILTPSPGAAAARWGLEFPCLPSFKPSIQVRSLQRSQDLPPFTEESTFLTNDP